MARIRSAVHRYRHTSHGQWALESLAELCFDRGQFLQASWYWQELLPSLEDPQQRAMFLAKKAIASHLAGEVKASSEALTELKENHPQAAGELGDKRWVLVDFVNHIRKTVKPDTSLARLQGSDWPGLWSMPGHVGVMEDVEVVLRPNWVQPNENLDGDDLKDQLIAKKQEILAGARRGNQSVQIQFRGGEARYKVQVSNRRDEFILPSSIHPIVLGDVILHRNNRTVTAHNIYTGDIVWEAFQFPMFRDQQQTNHRHSYSLMSVMDYGRFALSVGGGKVYAVGMFAKPSNPGYHFRGNQEKVPDTSAIAAFSLEAEGMLVWQIGQTDKATTDQKDIGLPGAKYLSVPTYYDGRLYVLAKHMENYWLLCLSSEDGSLLWKTQVAQTPAITSGYSRFMSHMLDLGTPPACIEGRVFVLTNAGVLGCFDTQTGQPVWAYQYETDLGGTRSRSYRFNVAGVRFGMNPIVVTPGRVSILPADCDKVMTFSFEDGKLLWNAPRQKMMYLAAVDENRLVVSGSYEPGNGSLAILSARNGKVLHQVDGLGDVYGRPAVTDKSVVVSVQAGVARLDLDEYMLTKSGPAEPDALLGNLVFAGGKMFAANPLGLAAYFPYETQYARISELLEGLHGQQRREKLFNRANVSFSARRYDRSLEDYLLLRDELVGTTDSRLQELVRKAIYRNYLALANTSDSTEEMGKLFLEAREYARSDEEKAHMLLRLARYHRMLGEKKDDVAELTKSIELATEIIGLYGQERLVDVQIGSKDPDNGRFDSRTPRLPGSVLADDFIASVIQEHGYEPLEPFDVLAKDALAQASGKEDPEELVAVAKKYKHGQYRDDALFRAAEIYYLRAHAGNGEKDKQALTSAVKLFSEVIADRKSPLRVSAAVALAAIYAKAGKPIAARMTLENISDQPDSTPVSFANIKGTLGEMRDQINSGKIPEASVKTDIEASIVPPLEKVFEVPGTDVFLVRDQEYRPVRIGQNLLVLNENRAPLLDTSRSSYEDAVSWEALTSVDINHLRRSRYYPPDMSFLGGLSREGKIIVLGDRNSCSGFSAETGKRIWHTPLEDVGISVSRFACMGTGPDSFVVADATGNLVCLEMETGKKRWDNKVRLQGRRRGNNRIGWPLRFLGGYVAVRSSDFQQMVLYDLKTGKAIQEFQGGVDARVSPDGQIFISAGGELQAFSQDNLQKPLWKKDYTRQSKLRILSAEAEMTFVTASTSGTLIDVFSSMGAAEPMASIAAGKIDARDFVPLRALSDNKGGVVVLGTTKLRGRPGQVYGRVTNCQNYYLRRYDISSGRLSWTCELVKNQSQILDQPLRRVGDHILAGCHINNRQNAAWLIDIDSGEIAEHLVSKEARDNTTMARIRALSIPAVTSGRLVMEDEQGLTVYRGR
jgi:outer membrane protein assembly factor BamB